MSSRAALLILLTVCLAASAVSQQPTMPGPSKEHDWLRRFTGKWTSQSKAILGSDSTPVECSGRMESRSLGGFWVVNELTGDVAGQSFTGIQTIGYDADAGKYVGTWVDSLMTHMWHYSGRLDEGGNKLVLVTEGPNLMDGGKLTKFRDSYEFKSPDLIVSKSEMLGEDGKWAMIMQGEMKRAE